MPLISPNLLRLRPDGNVLAVLQVIGDGPSARNWNEYDLFTAASEIDDVVIIGAVFAVNGLST